MNNLIKKEQKINHLIKNSIKALSDKWFSIRSSMISATDFGTILGINHSNTVGDLLDKKIYNLRMVDNKYTLHGKKFEDQAIQILEKKLNINIKEIGFTISNDKTYLGATPDGITIYDNEIHLIEIKCPFTRQIDGCVPYNYYSQMQLQMYVCDVKKCLFFECEFEEINKEKYNTLDDTYTKGYNKEYNIYWILHDSNLVLVERDDTFLNKYFGKLNSFHKKLETVKNTKKNSKKRKLNEIDESQNKRRKLNTGTITTNSFVLSRNHMKNYVIKSKCNVWLNFFGNKYYKEHKKENQFTKELLKRSKYFKKKYNDKLINKCIERNLSYKILPKFYKFNDYLYELTMKYMKDNVDVIINPMLYYKKEDIFCNSSYIMKGKTFTTLYNSAENEDIKFSRQENNKYHIVNKVIKNIKFTNEGKTLSNNQNQIHYLYTNRFDNYILSSMQKFKINKSFIIGTKWNYVKDGIKHSDNCDSKVGYYIHDNGKDELEIKKYKKWINNIYKDDDKYILLNDNTYRPSYSKSENTDWTDFKKYLLEQHNDINLLYGVGRKKQKLFHDENIYSWKDDNLTSLLNNEEKMRKFKISKKDSNIMKKIIHLNKTKSTDLIYPTIINNFGNWLQDDTVEIYTDFETLNDFIGPINMIYLIGMYVKFPNNKFKYYSFFATEITLKGERDIMKEWLNKIKEIKREYKLNYEPNIYCWSKAEQNFINQYNKRHNSHINVKFIDLLELIKQETILIKGNIYGFSIKDVVKYMYQHKMINRNYKLDCNSGDLSIISAIKYYQYNDKKEYVDLIKYNEVDCCVMFDILNYFRNYYSK